MTNAVKKPFCSSKTLYAGLFCLTVSGLQHVAAQTPHQPLTQPQALTREDIFNDYFNNWYQVELIVFERIEQDSDDAESWPKNISLSYPPHLTFLIEEKTETKEGDIEEKDDNPLDANPESDDTNNSELLETLKRSTLEDPLNQKYLSAVEKSERERMTPEEQPYTILGEEFRALNDEARRIGRDRAMRVLLHRSWRQPMTNQEQALSIVMTGGDIFGEHYELEGSIKLFVSRYLHLHTNIWLTQFEANVGQENQHWPPIPVRPQPLVAEVIFDTETEGNFDTGTEDDKPAEYIQTLSFEEELKATPSNFNFSYNDRNTLDFGTQDGATLLDNYTRLTQQPYLTSHIITLKQQRRMRSRELHYLDHPKLGMIINIEKYTPELPAEPLPEQ